MVSATPAGMTPPAHGMRLLGTCGVGGRGDCLQVMLSRGYCYVTHPFSGGFSVVDVRDPRSPRTVRHYPAASGASTLHLQLHDELLIVASEAELSTRPDYLDRAAYFGAQLDYGEGHERFQVGLEIYDVADPARPRLARSVQIPGFGVHRLSWAGGPTALASEMPPGAPDFGLTILDMREPTRPEVVSRWRPGDEDGESGRWALHHAILAEMPVSGRDRQLAFGAWRDGGLQIVDVARARPALVGALPPSAWGGGNTHTTLPLPGRRLVLLVDESVVDHAADGVRRIWLVDVSDPRTPTVLAAVPEPGEHDFAGAGGVFGPHNLHENRPGTWQSDQIVFATYQNAGVRAYDVSDPLAPREVGRLVPPPPTRWHDPRVTAGTPLVPQSADLIVSTDGLVIASDLNAGLSIIEFAGK